MLVSKSKHRAALEKIDRLEREAEQARRSVASYQNQERELVEAVVAARVDARELRNRAEKEASSIIEAARAEAARIQLEARSELATIESEITRLRGVRRDVSTSLEQSVTALRSALTKIPVPSPPDFQGNVTPASQQPASWMPAAPMSTSDGSNPIAEFLSEEQFAHARTSVLLNPGTASPGEMRARQSVRHEDSPVFTSAGSSTRTPRVRRKFPLRIATAVVLAIGSVGLTVGVSQWWRGSARQTAGTVASGEASTPLTTAKSRRPNAGEPVSRGAGAKRGSLTAGVNASLRAVRPVWVRAEVDGRTTMARLLNPGEDVSMHASREVVLRVGDAGALLVGVNGRPPGKIGRTGEVVTTRLAPEPAVAAATAAPGTSAAALLATPTSARAKPVLQPASPVVAAPLPIREPVAAFRRAGPMPQAVATSESARAPAVSPHSSGEASDVAREEADVLRAHQEYFEAVRRGDNSTMGRLLADGFSATGAPVTDDAGFPYEISVGEASVEVRGVGAFVSGKASQRISAPDGQSTRDQSLQFSEVWVKRNGQWQLLNVRFVTGRGTR
jgi:hypothetical protein